MISKNTVPCFACLVLSLVLLLSPISVRAAIKVDAAERREESKYATYQRNMETVQSALITSVQAFNASRSFDVYYGDVPKLSQVLQSIAGIEVKEIYEVDPMNGYPPTILFEEGSNPAAVRFSLLTTDLETTLDVFKKMQLPVRSIMYSSPNELYITVLTGGDL